MSVAKKRVEAVPEPQARPEAVAPVPAPTEERKPKRRFGRRMLMIAVPLALALGGGWFWLIGGRYVTTDNAYVQQPMVQISAEVAGRVSEVAVVENQHVDAGDAAVPHRSGTVTASRWRRPMRRWPRRGCRCSSFAPPMTPPRPSWRRPATSSTPATAN